MACALQIGCLSSQRPSGRSIGSDPLVLSAFVHVQPHSVASSPLSITQRVTSAIAVPESAPLITSPG
jgi:hypothetical protein